MNSLRTTYSDNANKARLNSLDGPGVMQSRGYDANGNTTSITDYVNYSPLPTQHFDYDDLNRVWRYREDALTVTYAYNAFGQRQIKDDGTTTTRFVYNGASLLHEDNGATERDYIYLDGELVAFVQGGTVYYVHNDHLGRPEKVTYSTSVVVWSSQNNAFDNTPTIDYIGGLNVGFPGQYYDVESGTYYNYFRTYDSTTGRYLQSDPIGLAGGLNTAIYVYGNPVKFVDPLGLDGGIDDCGYGRSCVEEREPAPPIRFVVIQGPMTRDMADGTNQVHNRIGGVVGGATGAFAGILTKNPTFGKTVATAAGGFIIGDSVSGVFTPMHQGDIIYTVVIVTENSWKDSGIDVEIVHEAIISSNGDVIVTTGSGRSVRNTGLQCEIVN